MKLVRKIKNNPSDACFQVIVYGVVILLTLAILYGGFRKGAVFAEGL